MKLGGVYSNRKGVYSHAHAPGAKVHKKRNRTLRLVLFLIVLPALLFSGYTWLTLHYAYSTGQRSGYIQKVSKKGWLCKTWEGEG
jgi:hypothetical protein